MESGIRYLTSGNVGEGYYKEQGESYISKETFDKLRCLEVFPGDLMISRLNLPVGRACIVPDKYPIYVVAVDNVILRPDNIYNIKFLLYIMNTDGYAKEAELISRGTTMKRISRSLLGEIKIAVPNLAEQNKIADFLDKKCEEMDSVTSKIEKQIELLKDYKKSLITETVTKGLDKNVPMKDSGIEWIGEIPECWEIKKAKYMFKIKDGTHDTPDYVDDNEIDRTYPLITTRNIENGKINTKSAFHISYNDFIDIYKRSNVEKFDLLMPMIGTVGNPVIVETSEKFAIKNVALFKMNFDRLFSKNIYYQFYALFVQEQIRLNTKGGVQSFISLEMISKIQLLKTSEKEIKEIVDFLDEKCSKIDSTISKKERQLDLMKEYRKSLIYEYVTGKKRVGGVEYGN